MNAPRATAVVRILNYDLRKSSSDAQISTGEPLIRLRHLLPVRGEKGLDFNCSADINKSEKPSPSLRGEGDTYPATREQCGVRGVHSKPWWLLLRAREPAPGSFAVFAAQADTRLDLACFAAMPLRARWPLFVIALTALLTGACREQSRPSKQADIPIVLISVDTLRADRVRPDLTPALVAFARDGITFEHAFSHVPLTLPSHTSIFTGQWPATNGVRDNAGYAVDPNARTLAAVLREHGYATGAAVSSYVLRHSTGIAKGFDSYDDEVGSAASLDATASRRGELTLTALLRWLDGKPADKIFCFLHLYDAHAPYFAPATFHQPGRSDYDAAVAYADSTVGAFLADLKRRGLYDRSLIVLLSDHGEGLGDHGELDHGVFVYNEDIHVPLIVKLPGQARAGEHNRSLAALSDVFPTILHAAGLAPEKTDGQDLLGRTVAADRQVDAESYYGRLHLHWHELNSTVTSRWQYIEAPVRELYDLDADPAEKQNRAEAERRTAFNLAQSLASRVKPIRPPSALGDEEQRKLAALGYVSGSATGGGDYPDPKDRVHFLTMYRRAERLARTGGTVEAIPLLETVTKEAPEIVDAWLLLAKGEEALGHRADSIAVLRQAAGRFPDNTSLSLLLAETLARAGQREEARKIAGLDLVSDPVGANELLATIELSEGKPAVARTHLDAAIAAAPHRVPALLAMARVEKQLGDWNATLSTLDRAKSELEQQHAPIARGLEGDRGEALLHLERGPEAETAFRTETQQFPDDVPAWGNLAVILVVQGRRDEARAAVAAALKANPGAESRKMAAEVNALMRGGATR
jgi:choline-sulfatase